MRGGGAGNKLRGGYETGGGDINEAYNIDCMEYMRNIPDKAFDLAVVDPPYGDAVNQEGMYNRFGQPGSIFEKYKRECSRTGGTWAEKYGKKIIGWDVAPTQEYFQELFRVSRNQIIWGGNYFSLPPTRCFLIWRKLTISESFTMAMCEYAWTSFNSNAKLFEFPPQGRPGERFHPTQKPVELYAWIYKLCAKPGDKILDTHLGSGSSRIAAYDAGLDFVGCEIDKTYFELEEKRFSEHTAQLNLFIMED